MNKPFYKTRLFIEVDIETQFGPRDAISLAANMVGFPAVTKAVVTKVETNYIPFSDKDSNLEVLNKKAIQIK